MATEGPSAFFAARGAKARDLPDVRLLLTERAAGLAAAPEEERDEESIWLENAAIESADFLALDARPFLECRRGRGGCKRRERERELPSL